VNARLWGQLSTLDGLCLDLDSSPAKDLVLLGRSLDVLDNVVLGTALSNMDCPLREEAAGLLRA